MEALAEGKSRRNEEVAAPPVAELRSVTKRYGEVIALEGFDLRSRPGELLALLGPNGAGKTTAVKLLLGLTRPDAGSARLFGASPWTSEARTRVGAMLQVSNVPETLRVGEHLELFRSYYPDPMPVERLLEAAGLHGLAGRPFGKLSGGQRRRVLFALALCGDPDLLILDEPTAGLDVESRRTLWREIRRLVGQGKSVLLTTHYLEEADALADRIAVLHSGHLAAEGSPAEIKDRAAGRRIRCVTSLDRETILALAGVHSVRHDGAAVEITASDAETVLAELFRRDPRLADLQVSGAGLEEAFLQLTR